MNQSSSSDLPEADQKEEPTAITRSALGFQIPGWVYTILIFGLLGVIGWFYAQTVDKQIIGFTHDDGVYLTTAKSLATGHGFRLLHVVGHPAEVKYPFIYPLLLAPIWILFPKFPENIPIFSYFSIALTLSACWLIYQSCRIIHRFPGWLALGVVALFASGFFVMYFYSTVMSEAPYLFLSMLTLWVFYQFSQKEKTLSLRSVAVLIVLSAMTFLTRVPGLALMAAIGTWLLMNRQWKNAVIYGVGCLLLGVLPWSLWVKLETPKLTDLNYALVNAYSNYGLEFVLNYFGGKSYWDSLAVSFSSFLNRLLEDMFPVVPHLFKIYPAWQKIPHLDDIKTAIGVIGTYLLAGYFLLQGIRTITQSFAKRHFSPQFFSVPGLYLFFYMLLIIVWNYEDQMARFITVVVPLLWIYFFKPALPLLEFLRLGALRSSNQSQRIKAILIWGMLAVISIASIWPVQNSYRIVHRSRNQHWVESGQAKWLWGEYQNSFAWIRKNTPANAPLGAASDVVYYLYTDRSTFYVFYASLKRIKGRFVSNAFPLLMQSLDQEGVQYLVVEPHMQTRVIRAPMNLVAQDLMAHFPERFQLVYTSPRQTIRVFKILPAKARR